MRLIPPPMNPRRYSTIVYETQNHKFGVSGSTFQCCGDGADAECLLVFNLCSFKKRQLSETVDNF
jgi:hypothetical protein